LIDSTREMTGRHAAISVS